MWGLGRRIGNRDIGEIVLGHGMDGECIYGGELVEGGSFVAEESEGAVGGWLGVLKACFGSRGNG